MDVRCSNNTFFLGYSFKIAPMPPPLLPWLHELVLSLFLNITPVYLTIATIGNILSMVVFRRQSMSSISVGFIFLCFTDLIILYFCLLGKYFYFKAYFTHCQFVPVFLVLWVRKSFEAFSHWLLVLVTIEQTLALFRAKKRSQNKQQQQQVGRKISSGKFCCFYLTLMAFTFFVNLHYFFMPVLISRVLIHFYLFMNTFDNILTGAVPFLIMAGLDIAMAIKLCLKNNRNTKRIVKGEGGELMRRRTPSMDNGCKKTDDTQTCHGNEDRSPASEGAKLIIGLTVIAILFDMPSSVNNFIHIPNLDVGLLIEFLILTRHALSFIIYFSNYHFRCEVYKLIFRRCRPDSKKSLVITETPLQTITGRL